MSRKQDINRKRDEYFRSLDIARVRKLQARRFEVSSEDRLQLGMLTSGWPEYLQKLEVELSNLEKRRINRADDAAAELNTHGFRTGYGRLWTARLIRVARAIVFGEQRDVAKPRKPKARLSPSLSPSGQPKLLLNARLAEKNPKSPKGPGEIGAQGERGAKPYAEKKLSKAERKERRLLEKKLEHEQRLQTAASRRERHRRIAGILKEGDPSIKVAAAAKGFSFLVEKKPRRVTKPDVNK